MIYELIKALEIKTFIVFVLVFAYYTILSRFFFFSIISLYFSIPAIIRQIFNPTSELESFLGTPTKETKVEVKTYPVPAKTKITIH